MRPNRLATASALAVIAVTAATAAAAPPPHWTGPLRWHLDSSAPTRFVFMRQLGTASSTNTDTPDDTKQIAFDTFGLHIVTNSAPWKTISLARWIPRDAKAVRLSFHTIITRGASAGESVVYAFIRAPGSRCCVGPPGFRDYPVDFSYQGNLDHEGEVAQAVSVEPASGIREWSTGEVVVRNRSFQFSWGYRRMPDDALAIGVYLVAYAD